MGVSPSVHAPETTAKQKGGSLQEWAICSMDTAWAAKAPFSMPSRRSSTPRATARPQYREVVSVVSQDEPGRRVGPRWATGASVLDQGVTFDLDGEERPFPLDVIPRVFTDHEWDTIAEGVAQRVRARGLSGRRLRTGRILHDEVVPHRIVTSSPGFLRAVHGFDPANGVRIHVAGIDVVRDHDGSFKVLEDNIRCPSGVSYVLANRQAMARVLPEVFWGQPIHMVTDYPARLVQSLRQAAPAGVADPTVVVLTPGV